MPSNGLVYITKTTFSAVSSVSIDNCFSATYLHYYIARNFVGSAGDDRIDFRLRASGSDSSTTYRTQDTAYNGSSIVSSRNTSNTQWNGHLGYVDTSADAYNFLIVMNPFSSVKTTARSKHSSGIVSTIFGSDRASLHDQTTSYDGFTFFGTTGTITGSVTVYGLALS